MTAQIKEFTEIINHYGWAGWAMVGLYLIWKYATPALSKIWDFFTKWFAPEAFAKREAKRKQDAKEAKEEREKDENARRLADQSMLNRAFQTIEGSTKELTKIAIILDNLVDVIQQGHAERNNQYVILSTRLTNIEIDLGPIYTHLQKERPSQVDRKRNATQPNQALPTQEGKSNARNNQRGR